ncbi:DUF6503 family protein [Pontibacter beigongshangensis]|uniref:DUF6503 family protein n=1 Tax=Pontibacter beigongshangensis TaxID=2574733 RepID=UPI00164FB816|nr:DUF6503 family protein [Pontibacter beigongshangensis]
MLSALLFLFSCDPTEPDPKQVVENALKAHGHAGYQQGVISFRTGGVQYRVLRHEDAFVYGRTFKGHSGQRVHDVVQNSGFTRTVNDQEVKMSQEMTEEVASSVSKEIFLALLPFNLNNASEIDYEGNTELKGEMYHKIRFRMPPEKNGAGEEMELVGWFHERTHMLDYIAYAPEKEGAVQFWEAKNPRMVGGIRFQDYNIYATTHRISLERLDNTFELGRFNEPQEITLEEVKASDLPSL